MVCIRGSTKYIRSEKTMKQIIANKVKLFNIDIVNFPRKFSLQNKSQRLIYNLIWFVWLWIPISYLFMGMTSTANKHYVSTGFLYCTSFIGILSWKIWSLCHVISLLERTLIVSLNHLQHVLLISVIGRSKPYFPKCVLVFTQVIFKQLFLWHIVS